MAIGTPIELYNQNNDALPIGSISVSHHMLNEESRKYFTQSLTLSGVATIWNGYLEGNHRCMIELFAKSLNRSIDTDNLIDFMLNASADEINEFSKEHFLSDLLNNLWWPIIEGQC